MSHPQFVRKVISQIQFRISNILLKDIYYLSSKVVTGIIWGKKYLPSIQKKEIEKMNNQYYVMIKVT